MPREATVSHAWQLRGFRGPSELLHQTIDTVFLDTWFSFKSKFLHFNVSQWETSEGADLAEQDFDIVCKKFMAVCLAQCSAPEAIYSKL